MFCLDNDGEKTLTDSAIHKAAERLISFGKEVYIAIPNQIKNNKTDFNDIARVIGIAAVKTSINNSVSYQDWRSSLAKNGINPELNNAVNMAASEHVANQKIADRQLTRLALATKNEQNIKIKEHNNLQNNNDLTKQNMQKVLVKTEREIN